YTVEARPDTGLPNGKLGIWLFLASEVMLFGALFSTYIILRIGATDWPHGELNVWLGMANTFILIGSSVMMVMAWAWLKLHDFANHRLYLITTFVLSGLFLVNKYFEYANHLAKGEGPWHTTFLAIYFTMTGLHGLHIIGGMIVMAYFIGPGAKMWKTSPEQFANRIEYTGLYSTSSTRGCTGTSSTSCGSSCSRCCTCYRGPNVRR